MRTCVLSLLAAALAAVAWGESARTVTVPVTGLTAESRETVADALKAIARNEFVCAVHPGTASGQPGTCATCKGPLAERKAAALSSAEASVEERSMALALAPGRTLRLTEVFAALEAGPARLDAGRFVLEGPVTLHISGMRCPN